MSFLPSRNVRDDDQAPLELAQPTEDDPEDSARRLTDSKLQTSLSPMKLQTRLRGVAYDADIIQGEQGVNVLYLALGFLKWFEASGAEQARFAPLILLPVTLSRASASERFKVAFSGDEIGTNLSLQERLKTDRVALPDLPDVEDLSPDGYAEALRKVIAQIPGWEVQPNRIALGLFSFAKLMMYRDLDPEKWPLRKGLLDNAILGGLLDWGFRDDSEPLVSDDVEIDPIVDIATAGHVVDADGSQMLAINDVSSGRNLVIQGPPGTGKSQTITNLIASAVRDGKRVLFVAEKMAALNVVRNNLDRIGLSSLCLELHSHKAKKKDVLQSLKETHEAGRVGAPRLDTAAKLRTDRDLLNAHAARIHEPLNPSARTPFQVFSRLARLQGTGLAPPDFQLKAAQGWTAPEYTSSFNTVGRLARQVKEMGIPDAHPWKGVGLDHVLPQDAERFSSRSGALAASLAAWRTDAEGLSKRVSAPCTTLTELGQLVRLGKVLGIAPDVDLRALGSDVWLKGRKQIVDLVAHGFRYADARRKLEGVFLPGAWDTDPDPIRATLAAHGRSLFRWLNGDYRRAVYAFRAMCAGEPTKDHATRLSLLDTLAEGRKARHLVAQRDSVGRNAFGDKWSGENSDWPMLHAIERWDIATAAIDLPHEWRKNVYGVGDRMDFSRAVATLDVRAQGWVAQIQQFIKDLKYDLALGFGNADLTVVALETVLRKLHAFASSPGRLSQWCNWRVWSDEAREQGLAAVVDRLADGRLEHSIAVDVFDYAAHESLARQAFDLHRELAMFDGRSHETLVSEFQQLDRRRLELARDDVKARHSEMRPAGNREVGEIGTLAQEWNKKRRHKPLRQLVKAAGSAMQSIKPVWMMSPMSLAQFVEPGILSFDLVLMDEASQVRPVEALGAIARGQQLVVVGDEMQLPPTSFFDRVSIGDEEPVNEDEGSAVADFESILGLCSAQGIPDRMLRWHYRSQHESLIAVSNLEFYRRLFIVPTANAEELGLRFHKGSGPYDRGRTATNRSEAREVALAVIEHARRYRKSERHPDGMSLGVGAFSVTQRDAILDELELLWRQNPDLAPFFDKEAGEPFFVKNLESIQGDERDVVFISIGYGPDQDGVITGNFGPLTRPGGERRLNVLISRARRRCEVFSSMTAPDIDLGRTQSFGVRVLKTFLQYAETGHLDRAAIGKRAPDSDFEEDVAGALTTAGYLVEHQVGVAGFFVDLAIKDPDRNGRYLLGIECDGARYHSSRSARDRDRLRDQVLKARHWRIHHIWGTDWYRRRSEELQRVINAIERAKTLDSDPPPDPVEPPPSAPSAEPSPPPPAPPILEHPPARHSQPLYKEADFVEPMGVEPHQLHPGRVVTILVRIVEIEGPVHAEEIARRYAAVCGKQRAGARIQDTVEEGLRKAVREGKLYKDGDFYSLTALGEVVPRNRSAVGSLTLKTPEMLPPVEIRTGILSIVADHLGVAPSEAISEVARMFGFQRTGQDLQRVIEEQLRVLLGQGALELRNQNKLYLTQE